MSLPHSGNKNATSQKNIPIELETSDVRPKVAIVCANSLTVMGMRQLLQSVKPDMNIQVFASVAQLSEAGADQFFHFFVDISILLTDTAFFAPIIRHTIVLTTAREHAAQLAGYHCLCVNVPEKQLVKDLLSLMRQGHAKHGVQTGVNRGDAGEKGKSVLSKREIEVLSLVAQGLINKEIADRLCISLTTVITHRKNITEKLNMRSVSALTIYAVMHGYVDFDKI